MDLSFAADGWGPGRVSVAQDGIVIPDNARNCSSKLVVNYPDSEGESVEVKFTFQTYGKAQVKSATMKLMIEKCKVKSLVLTRKNLVLR